MVGTKNYANQKGKQMSIVYNMIKDLAGLKVSDSDITEWSRSWIKNIILYTLQDKFLFSIKN